MEGDRAAVADAAGAEPARAMQQLRHRLSYREFRRRSSEEGTVREARDSATDSSSGRDEALETGRPVLSITAVEAHVNGQQGSGSPISHDIVRRWRQTLGLSEDELSVELQDRQRSSHSLSRFSEATPRFRSTESLAMPFNDPPAALPARSRQQDMKWDAGREKSDARMSGGRRGLGGPEASQDWVPPHVRDVDLRERVVWDNEQLAVRRRARREHREARETRRKSRDPDSRSPPRTSPPASQSLPETKVPPSRLADADPDTAERRARTETGTRNTGAQAVSIVVRLLQDGKLSPEEFALLRAHVAHTAPGSSSPNLSSPAQAPSETCAPPPGSDAAITSMTSVAPAPEPSLPPRPAAADLNAPLTILVMTR